MEQFADWEQDLIIGGRLRVSSAWSQYDASKLINIGINRWSFKPDIGISKALGP